MKHRVRWKRSAQRELADIWINANSEDRAAITSAVHSIEQELARLSSRAGESRTGDERILFEAPVAVLFEAAENQQDVLVLQIWRY